MAINLAHGPDLDDRVEQPADRLGLKGRGRKTAIIKRPLALPGNHAAHDRTDRAPRHAAAPSTKCARSRRSISNGVTHLTPRAMQALGILIRFLEPDGFRASRPHARRRAHERQGSNRRLP